MNKFKLLFLGLVVFAFGCGSTEQNDSVDENVTDKEVVDNNYDDKLVDEDIENEVHEGVDLYDFIINSGKGWEAVDFVYYYSFMEDGRIFGQGDDGENSMWEGYWTLDGDVLTATTDDGNETTYTLQADGEYLIIDGSKYQKSNY